MAINPLIASAGITAGAGIIGGLVGRGGDGAHTAQLYAQRNMRLSKFLTRKLDSQAMQRRMRDMRKAGLNPILAGQYSPGGGTIGALPAPNTAGHAMAEVQGFRAGMEGVSTATDAVVQANTADKVKAEVDNVIQMMKTGQTQEALNVTQRALTSLSYNEKLVYIDMLQEQLKIARRLGEVAESDFGKAMRYLGEFTGAIGNIFGGSATYRMGAPSPSPH